MKVAINAWVLRKRQLDGIGVFTKEVFSRLIPAHPDVEFLVLVDRGFTADYFNFPNVRLLRVFPALRHPVLYVAYHELVLPGVLRRYKADLFLAPDSMLSLASRVPQVPVFHDLNFVHQPEDLNFRNRVYYNTMFPRFARKATRIAVVSEYSRQDIETVYPVTRGKLDVIHSGIVSNFRPLLPADIQMVRDTHAQGQPYFLFVGTLHPRKNIVRLLQAFDLFKSRSGSPAKLLLAGNFMWDSSAIKEVYEAMSHKADVVFAGRVDDATLRQLYAAALALTFVSTFEGFGLPILEAFWAEVPVITSNTTSMPEVAGGAALLVDPLQVLSIAEAMHTIVADDGSLRADLVAKGRVQRLRYSWDETAALLWESAQKALEKR